MGGPTRHQRYHGRSNRKAFTLVELLVVVLIILLVSALVLPTVLPALTHTQVTEAGRILQAAIVQARATAVKAQAPRGIRLLPDPTYASSPTILASNRWTAIEPGPDYTSGMVVVWPVPTQTDINNGLQPPFIISGGTPPPYPVPNSNSGVYPYLPQSVTGAPYPGQCLMIEESPFVGNDSDKPLNNPTSWFWNVRIGDKIQVGGSGRSYTIVGPMTVQNPELFVNDGPPGQPSTLVRTYTNTTGNKVQRNVEYLYLVNGQDDNNDGFVDEGWDGFNNNYNYWDGSNFNTIGNGVPTPDELFEWQEVERWTGAEQGVAGNYSNYGAALTNTTLNSLPAPAPYAISRRPVVSQGARETFLPSNIVIDMTTWNSTQERSRLPVDPKSHYVDIMLQPNGQVVLTTEYSSPSSFGEGAAFLHFWLAERQDIMEVNDQRSAQPPVPYLLPMPKQTTAYPNGNDQVPRFLNGERLLVTLFTRSGQITTNAIEFFNGIDINTPFYDSQLGARQAK